MSYRLFVGLPLPGSATDTLKSLCAGLSGARWVAPENMHVTLRFIGEVDGAMADEIHAALSDISAPGFSMSLSGVGRFSSGPRTRAVWAGVTPEDPVAHLAAKVEQALVRTGCDPERRKFKPHVTLARLKTAPEGRVLAWLEAHGAFVSPSFAVDHFVLYRSHLSSAGAQYEALADYPLQRQ